PGAGPFTATIDRQTAFYPGSGIPTFDVSFVSTGPNAGPQDGLLPQDIGSLFGQAFNTDVYNDIDQIQLGGSWANLQSGALARIDFGIQHQKQEFDTRNAYSGLLPAGFWLTSAQHWPDDQWRLESFSGLLDEFSNGGSFSFDEYYTADLGYIIDGFETVGADNFPCCYWPDTNFWGPDFQDPSGDRGRFWPGPLGNSGLALVEEDINSFYTQAVFQDMFNGMPFNAILGLRYEDTETTSFGQEVPATAIVWVNGNEFSYEFADNPSLRRGEGDNDFWLPSVNLDLEVMEDVVARFAYSRTISRPPIGALSPNRTFIGNPNVRNRRVSAGNPDLLPFVSDNFDLSLEWYYGPGSYASIGYFRKKVDNFLVSTTVERTFEGLLDPYIGALAEQARAQLMEEGIQADDQAVFARINEILGRDTLGPVRAEPGDPLAVFQVTTTENAEVGNLWGFEMAVQHMFGDTGWGLQANATVVNGDVDADRDVINQQFALPGLSDSANLSVFFENELISARLAYNWRDEFLSGFDQFGAPVFTEKYTPLDLNVTYYVNNELSVFFEALNITEETQRIYSRYPEQFLRGNQYGARYNLGLRYRF
ncbi:MAG: TonB-dependent receptor, partial [Xanthomonadales bacterium]|nr:TonB-dependent receptor [Xanthomonadales bacterium]